MEARWIMLALIVTAGLGGLLPTRGYGQGLNRGANRGVEVKEDARLLMDFKGADPLRRWTTVNDNVMGGRSQGGPAVQDGKLIFSGRTNTNGGGFSSIRTRPEAMGLGEFAGLRIRVRGDGRTYKADVRTSQRIGRMSVAYRSDFETVDGEWIEVEIPFASFDPTSFGRNVRSRVASLDVDDIQAIGLMIYDKKDGPFRLEVDWIKAYRAE